MLSRNEKREKERGKEKGDEERERERQVVKTRREIGKVGRKRKRAEYWEII